MNVELVNRIKRLVIIALASDDELMEALVLKGGNAIDIAYSDKNSSILSRTSYDLDFSIESGDFQEEEYVVAERIQRTLNQTFLEHGFIVIDYKFYAQPKIVRAQVADFWGGYKVTFKVLEKEKFDQTALIETHRRQAVIVRPDRSPTFEIEFSKFEYVSNKKKIEVDGYQVYVYTPEMIVFEKLRAVCQQLPQYANIVPSHTPRARARDFYDIHLIMNTMEIEPASEENLQLIKNIFSAKHVPVDFIKQIRYHQAIHRDNWESVKDTVSQSEQLKDFDFYLNFVLQAFEPLTFP